MEDHSNNSINLKLKDALNANIFQSIQLKKVNKLNVSQPFLI